MDRPPSTLDAAHELSAADQDRFYADMSGKDALTVVVRAAIYIESQIIHLLESNLDPAHLNKMDLSYLQRVQLATAIGMEPRLVKPLKALGEIRNKFAHRLDASLSENEAENFYSAFDSVDKRIIQGVYQRMRKATPKKHPSLFKSLPPLERFTLCAAALRSALISARPIISGAIVARSIPRLTDPQPGTNPKIAVDRDGAEGEEPSLPPNTAPAASALRSRSPEGRVDRSSSSGGLLLPVRMVQVIGEWAGAIVPLNPR